MNDLSVMAMTLHLFLSPLISLLQSPLVWALALGVRLCLVADVAQL